MARRPALTAALVLALVATGDGPALAEPVIGGTLDLRAATPDRSVVVSRGRAAAVALLRGRPDVAAVGEPRADRVRLVELEPGDLEAAARWSVTGSGRTGAALAAVDQLVGDDAADLLVGVPRASVGRRGRAGAAFLISPGRRTARLRTGSPHAVTILGAAARDRAGAAVAAVPDLDGDGRPELAVGAPGADPAGRPAAGAAYLVPSRGLRLGDTVDLADPDAALLIAGPAAGARAGWSLAGSQDTDGDGRGEVLVGAPRLGTRDSGAAYLVRPFVDAPVDLAAGETSVLALLGARGERAGTAVAAPGDLDDDGRRELAVGAPRAEVTGRGRPGVVHVVTPPAGGGSVALASLSVQIEGEARDDRAGSSLGRAGDLSSGAVPGLLIGAPRADPLGRLSAGAVYAVFGRAAADGVDLALLGRGGIRLAGESPRAAAGSAVAGDVDVDRDGRDDVLAGSLRASTLLQAVPRVPGTPDGVRRCDALPASMVLDASHGLFALDDERLRGGALELLLNHPAADDRVIGAVEAAQLPAEVFLPLVPDTRAELRVVEDLVDESLARSYRAGDLRQALAAAAELNPAMRSAIVVAGPDAFWIPGDPPPFRTDVVAVGSTEPSLRALADSSGGRYAGVTKSDLQAQVALFDADRRCARPLRATIDGRTITEPRRVSTTSTRITTGLDASATVEDSSYADVVVTWTTPEVKIEPYELSVREVDHDTAPVEFTEEQVRQAARGEPVTEGEVTLTGGSGDTFLALRVELDAPSQGARAARHRGWVLNYGGYRETRARAAGSTRAYVQFFAAD